MPGSTEMNESIDKKYVYPFHASVPFLHPLKISENKRFSDVFMGYRNGTLA